MYLLIIKTKSSGDPRKNLRTIFNKNIVKLIDKYPRLMKSSVTLKF